MPLTVNVGLSRKASENYQSHGTSINLTAELDQGLLGRPEELQGAVADLYAQAEHALESRAEASCQLPALQAAPRGYSVSRQPGGNGSSHGDCSQPNRVSPGGNGRGHRTTAVMTASQRRAILAIAGKLQLDPDQQARELFSRDLADLDIRQASGLIDSLKTLQTAGANGGGR